MQAQLHSSYCHPDSYRVEAPNFEVTANVSEHPARARNLPFPGLLPMPHQLVSGISIIIPSSSPTFQAIPPPSPKPPHQSHYPPPSPSHSSHSTLPYPDPPSLHSRHLPPDPSSSLLPPLFYFPHPRLRVAVWSCSGRFWIRGRGLCDGIAGTRFRCVGGCAGLLGLCRGCRLSLG